MRTSWLAFSQIKSFFPWRSRGAQALTNALRVVHMLSTFFARLTYAAYVKSMLLVGWQCVMHTLLIR